MAFATQSRVLLVVNVQNDYFEGGTLPIPGAKDILPVINRLLLKKWSAVVFTAVHHPLNFSAFCLNHPGTILKETASIRVGHQVMPQVMWPDHCVLGTTGAQLHSQLNVRPLDIVLDVHKSQYMDTYSVFGDTRHESVHAQTRLLSILKELDTAELYVCGLATDYAVQYTVLDVRVLLPNTVVHVVEDAMKGISNAGVQDAMRKFGLEHVVIEDSHSTGITAMPAHASSVLAQIAARNTGFDRSLDSLASDLGLEGASESKANPTSHKAADIDDVSTDDLMSAVSHNDLKTFRSLLSQSSAGWMVNRKLMPLGLAPLHLAVMLNHSDIIRDLINAGADVNVQTADQDTALHLAVRLGHDDVVRYLLGVPKINRCPVNALGLSPLHVAAINGDWSMLQLLLDTYAECMTDKALVQCIEAKSEYGVSPVMFACASAVANSVSQTREQRDIVSELLSSEAGSARSSFQNRSRAVSTEGSFSNRRSSKLSKVGFLSPTAAEGKPKPKRERMLSVGTQGHADSPAEAASHAVEHLLRHIDEPSKRLIVFREQDRDGWSAFHFAAATGLLPVLNWPVLLGSSMSSVPINLATVSGYTPLHIAVWSGNEASVAVLLGEWKTVPNPWRNRVRVNERVQMRGHSELDLAIMTRVLDTARLLVRAGATAAIFANKEADILLHKFVLHGDGVAAELMLRSPTNKVVVSKPLIYILRSLKYASTCTFTFAGYHAPTAQHMYECTVCHQKICLVCATSCHGESPHSAVHMHKLRYLGLIESYCACRKDRCQALGVVDARELDGYKYQPKPIDTSAIRAEFEQMNHVTGQKELTALGRLSRLLARNSHEVWAKERREQGWVYGPMRDNTLKHHPGLVPYRYVSEENKQMDIVSAKQAVLVIEAVGYKIVQKSVDQAAEPWEADVSLPDAAAGTDAEAISAIATKWQPRPIDTHNVPLRPELVELVELLARNAHEVWAAEKIADGWVYAPTRLEAPPQVAAVQAAAPKTNKQLQAVEEEDEESDDDSSGFGSDAEDAALLDSGAEGSAVEEAPLPPQPSKCSPLLVPYKHLTEREKELGRKSASATIRSILYLGFEIQTRHTEQAASATQALARKLSEVEQQDSQKKTQILQLFKQGVFNAFLFSAAISDVTVVLDSLLHVGKSRFQGADVNAIDELGRSALYMAVMYDNLKTASVLIENGANVETPDMNGVPPLSVAAFRGNIEGVKLLINHGATYHLRDRVQLSPIHYAAFAGHMDVVELIGRKLIQRVKPGLNFDGDPGDDPIRLRRLVEVLLEQSHQYGVKTPGGPNAAAKNAADAVQVQLTSVAMEFLWDLMPHLQEQTGMSQPPSLARSTLSMTAVGVDDVAASQSLSASGPARRDSGFFTPRFTGLKNKQYTASFGIWHMGGSGQIKDIELEEESVIRNASPPRSKSSRRPDRLRQVADMSDVNQRADQQLRARVGAMTDTVTAKFSPLTSSVLARQYEVVELLLHMGADPNYLDDSGLCPYDRALADLYKAEQDLRECQDARPFVHAVPVSTAVKPVTAGGAPGSKDAGAAAGAAAVPKARNLALEATADSARWARVKARLKTSGPEVVQPAHSLKTVAVQDASHSKRKDLQAARQEREREEKVERAMQDVAAAQHMVDVMNKCAAVQTRRRMFALRTLAKQFVVFLAVASLVGFFTPVSWDYPSRTYAEYQTYIQDAVEANIATITTVNDWALWFDENLLWLPPGGACNLNCSNAVTFPGGMSPSVLLQPHGTDLKSPHAACALTSTAVFGENVVVGGIQLRWSRRNSEACAQLSVLSNAPVSCMAPDWETADWVKTYTLSSKNATQRRQLTCELRNMDNSNSWVVRNTKELTVSLTLYNPNLRVFAMLDIIGDFSAQGTASVTVDLRSFSPFNGRFPPSVWFELAFIGLLIVFTAGLAGQVIQYGARRALSIGWNLVDVILVLVLFMIIVTDIAALVEVNSISIDVADPMAPVDLHGQYELLTTERHAIAVMILLLLARVMKFMRIVPGAGPMVVAVGLTWQDTSVVLYMLVTIGITVMFAVSFVVAFGPDLTDYSSVKDSFVALFTMSFAQQWQSIPGATGRFLTAVLYIFYVVFAVVLLNLFIGIVTDVYPKARLRSQLEWEKFITEMMQEDIANKLGIQSRFRARLVRLLPRWCRSRLDSPTSSNNVIVPEGASPPAPRRCCGCGGKQADLVPESPMPLRLLRSPTSFRKRTDPTIQAVEVWRKIIQLLTSPTMPDASGTDALVPKAVQKVDDDPDDQQQPQQQTTVDWFRSHFQHADTDPWERELLGRRHRSSSLTRRTTGMTNARRPSVISGSGSDLNNLAGVEHRMLMRQEMMAARIADLEDGIEQLLRHFKLSEGSHRRSSGHRHDKEPGPGGRIRHMRSRRVSQNSQIST